MECSYQLNNVLCNAKQLSIFNYVYANIDSLLGAFKYTNCVDTWCSIKSLLLLLSMTHSMVPLAWRL